MSKILARRGYCRPNTTIKEVLSDTPSHKHPLNKNRLPIVAWAVSAILADITGKFETLGSNFRQETRLARLLPS